MNTVLNRLVPETPAQGDEYITFKVENHIFALPSQAILKVVATPPHSQGGMVSMGLVQLEQYSIQIIDLSELLDMRKASSHISKAGGARKSVREVNSDRAAENTNPPFLIVFQNSADDLCGIAVETPPDLVTIPSGTLKPVPPENRFTKALRWVSHVVIHEANSSCHTLLVLDLPLLLAPRQAEQQPTQALTFTIEPPVDSTD